MNEKESLAKEVLEVFEMGGNHEWTQNFEKKLSMTLKKLKKWDLENSKKIPNSLI